MKITKPVPLRNKHDEFASEVLSDLMDKCIKFANDNNEDLLKTLQAMTCAWVSGTVKTLAVNKKTDWVAELNLILGKVAVRLQSNPDMLEAAI